MRWDSALIPIHESPECRDRGINECCALARREGEVLSEMKSKEEEETKEEERRREKKEKLQKENARNMELTLCAEDGRPWEMLKEAQAKYERRYNKIHGR